MTDSADIVIVDALQMELGAVAVVLRELGITLEDCKFADFPCQVATLPTNDGPRRVVLARPTRMGAVSTTTTASALVALLRPTCLAMSGVCAGNPGDVTLGDVIIAETAYAYDEGKRTEKGFEGDHRQLPITDAWMRFAQEMSPNELKAYGAPSDSDRRNWLIEQLAADVDPSRHPARARYLEGENWKEMIQSLEAEKIIRRKGARFTLTIEGRDEMAERLAYGPSPITRLPFAIHVGPIASGNVVVKDGITWDSLKAQGVRTVLGLDMEAAAIARVAHNHDIPRWIVAKGVMDYANPKKDDRFKPFAAAASAQVLVRFLQTAPFPQMESIASGKPTAASASATNVVGNVIGSSIFINQSVTSKER